MHARNSKLLPNARALRKNMTKEERKLWYEFLRPYPVRFRRQEIIGNYIADFYCSKAALVVELDGSQHYEQSSREYDETRTAFFAREGIHVIRFSNLDVLQNFTGVCETIDREARRRTPQPLTAAAPLAGEP